jgi:hypothetical protein
MISVISEEIMEKSMKVSGFLICLSFVGIFWVSTGCNNTPVKPSPMATPTPSTPTCVWTPLAQVLGSNSSGNVVIHNSTEWLNFYNGIGLLSPIPTPPVNFSTQMVLAASEIYPNACSCNTEGPTITSVCSYSDHIEVDYLELPPPVGCLQPTPTILNICAALVNSKSGLAAMAQSALPVTWVFHPYLPTPTATP